MLLIRSSSIDDKALELDQRLDSAAHPNSFTFGTAKLVREEKSSRGSSGKGLTRGRRENRHSDALSKEVRFFQKSCVVKKCRANGSRDDCF
jgi:hypothetical protein